MNIARQDIVITGGASGIGLACARALCKQGARVWALDRDPCALESAQNACASQSHGPQFERCDVGDPLQVAACVERIEQASQGIDILVNNAAVLRDQTLVCKLGRNLKTHSLEDWQETLQTNLTGTFLMARCVSAAMVRAKRSGLIINVSSISRGGNPGQSAYAASKSAIDALTVTWSQELAMYGIRVVGFAPGFVETPMTERIPKMFLERIMDQTPLKRFGSLAECVHAMRFIIENDYLNGKTLELDGGMRF